MSIPEVFFRETIDLNRYSNAVSKDFVKTYNDVILVVSEDGVVQEFIKDKTEYLPMLVDCIKEWKPLDNQTQVWYKYNTIC